MYKRTDFANGLRLVSHTMKDRDSVAIGFLVGVGGRYENDPLKGAAHFLEHVVFKGSKQYSCEEIKERIEGVGGSLNAFTSEELTCYYAKVPSRHFERAFNVLSDMITYPMLKREDVVKESSVIIEEIKMYKDLPQYYVMELIDELIWPNHPLGKSLTGTPDTVSSMKDKELRGFHHDFYHPANLVISACGNVSHSALEKLSGKVFQPLKTHPKKGFIKADNKQNEPKMNIYKKATEQMHLVLGMLGYDEHHEDRYALTLLSIILGGNMSSRLFAEIREKRGLAYSISTSYKAMQDTGQFLIRAGVDNTKIVATLKVITEQLSRMRSESVGSSEFTRAREYILGQLLLGLEDTMEHMLWIGETTISKDKFQYLKDIIAKFERIKRSDVQRVAKDIIKQAKFNLAVIGPVDDNQQKELKSLLSLS